MSAPTTNLLNGHPTDELADVTAVDDGDELNRRHVNFMSSDPDMTGFTSSRWGERPSSSARDRIRRALFGRKSASSRQRARLMGTGGTQQPLEPFESSLKHPGSKGFIQSIVGMVFSSRVNWLLVFVPIGAVMYFARLNPLLVFTCNAIAIIPLSSLLTDATEMIASEAGDTIGALLNISFGNLVELILFIALANDQIRLVQASILGSILVNLLLILGSALLANRLSNQKPVLNSAETQLLACLLFVSVFVILMPTAFDSTFDSVEVSNGLALKMSRISSLMVLMIYVIYLVYEMKSAPSTNGHIPIPQHPSDAELEEGRPGTASGQTRTRSSANHPRTIRFADEDSTDLLDVSANKEAQHIELRPLPAGELEDIEEDPEDHDRPNEAQPSSRPVSFRHRRTRSHSLASSHENRSRESSPTGERRGATASQILRDSRASVDQILHHQPHWGHSTNKSASIVVLIVVSILMSMCCEFLVSTVDDVTRESSLSHSFIGLIILPVVGNIAEYVTVVTVAVRQKLDLAISVAVGSSIQIALCVTPLTVLAGWIMHAELALTFNYFEMATLVGTVMLVNLLILTDGSSDLRMISLKGALMCACYIIFGLGAFLAPSQEA